MESNEKKLSHIGFSEIKEPFTEEEKEILLQAEFMPMPGRIQNSKIRDVWKEQGISVPWGGKFKIQGTSQEVIEFLFVANGHC